MGTGERNGVVMQSDLGIANGVATLDEGGKLTSEQTPEDVMVLTADDIAELEKLMNG